MTTPADPVDPVDPGDPVAPAVVDAVAPEPAHTRLRWPGRAALALGVLTPVAVALGVAAASADAFLLATVAAWTAIGASGLAVAAGIVAVAGNWDRGAGIGAIALGLLGNPLVLLHGLDAAGGL